MSVEIKVPEAGESVTEGEITSWLKKDGEPVMEGEMIAEIETDKATLEINSPANGVLKTKGKEGDVVQVGDVIAEIDESSVIEVVSDLDIKDDLIEEIGDDDKEKDVEDKKVFEIKVPEAGESVTEGEITSWLKKDGEPVMEGEMIAEIETDKATLEINSPANGVLKTKGKEGDVVQVGDVIAEVTGGQSSESSHPSQDFDIDTPEEDTSSEFVEPYDKNKYYVKYPSPSAKRLMAREDIDASEILPTGKNGRIIKKDVTKAIDDRNLNNRVMDENLSLSEEEEYNFMEPDELDGDISIDLQRAVSNYMDISDDQRIKGTIYEEINMTQLIETYDAYGEEFSENNNVDMTYVAFFIKAISLSMKKHPKLNSFFDNGEIILNKDINIALSFDTDNDGIMMGVLKNTDKMDFLKIEKVIDEYSKKVMSGQLSMEELSDGTFSIVSMGDRGLLLSVPTLYTGQSATIALHNIKDRAISVDGRVVSAPMMYVSLSYDKKVVLDSQAVDFLLKIKTFIENPAGMVFLK